MMRFVCCLLLLAPGVVRGAEAVDFERDIAPLLVRSCIDCHQVNKRSGQLDLTTFDGLRRGGDEGPAVIPGKVEASLLIKRIASGEMPPRETKGTKPLHRDELERLKQWVAAGAKWPQDRELGLHEKTLDLEEARQFWAYRPVTRPAIPPVNNVAGASNPIDAFVGRTLEEKGIAISPRASAGDLLRRASLDVRGLPPTLDEQQQFLDDKREDAYERLVDRLLAEPAYGERWARHWLDLVRYADSNGYERDGAKPSVWQYRDYVIRALNSDKPYDRFVIEQLAGDELDDASFDQFAATGFHALGTWQDEVDPLEAAQYRADELDDMIRTTAQTFLGVTLGCARCHQHKFDPFTMVDYYSLAAILAPLKRPNAGRTDRDLPAGSPAQLAAEKDADEKLSQLEKRILSLDKELKEKPSKERSAQLAELKSQQAAILAARPNLPRVYRLFEDKPTAPVTHLLRSGRASNPGPVMQPRVPAVLTTAQPVFPSGGTHSTLRRRALAEWIASRDNPLTARVIVNRVWQHHFGTGIVATSSDFGHIGARPTHPELLDWLAHWFMYDANWSLKKLHRLILTSETYRQNSQWNEAATKVDPENRWLWRYPYRRLDVEAIRDSMLVVSGAMNRQAFGPAVYLPQPEAVIEAHTDKQAAWKQSSAEELDRRTVYAFVKRTLILPMFDTFDFCDTTQSTDRRAITSVATQALTLFNGSFVNQQAERLARRLEREAGNETTKQIDLAYQLALARCPTVVEAAALRTFLDRESASLRTEKSLNELDARHRALVQMCRAVLNLNEFVYPN